MVLASLLLSLDYSREGTGSYDHYVSNWEDVGIENLVTAVLTDWRVYDTLGEALALFIALFGVYSILGGDNG